MRSQLLLPSLLSASLLLFACGGSGTAPPADLGEDVNYATESAETASHGSAPDSLSTSKALSSLFVKEDPTLNVSMTAAQNADAVAAQLTTSVMISSCANANILHTTGTLGVMVSFGASCTLPDIGSISGSASATIAKVASTITVALTLTDIVVNGVSVSGTVALSTTDATTFTFTIHVSTSVQQVSFDGTAVIDADGKGVTLNGSGTSTKSGLSLNFTMANVHHEFSGCYADTGTMTVTKPTKNKRDMSVTLQETIAFSSTTPTTGMVTVTIAGVTTPTTLPTTSSCPPS